MLLITPSATRSRFWAIPRQFNRTLRTLVLMLGPDMTMRALAPGHAVTTTVPCVPFFSRMRNARTCMHMIFEQSGSFCELGTTR